MCRKGEHIMTYEEWSEEYYESAARLAERIEQLKAEMKTASADMLGELGKRLEMFRIMRYECLDTARTLGRRKGEC